MKQPLIALAAATVLALGVTACDTSDTATDTPAAVDDAERGILPKATSTTAPAEVELPQSTKERLFLQVMRDRGIPATVELAQSICDVLDLGVPAETVIAMGVDNGLSASDTGYVLGASTAAFCPEHSDALGMSS